MKQYQDLTGTDWKITKSEKVDSFSVQIQAGILTREVRVSPNQIVSTNLSINGQDQTHHLLSQPLTEFSISTAQANPNARPVGITAHEGQGIIQKNEEQDGTDGLNISGGENEASYEKTKWENPWKFDQDQVKAEIGINVSEQNAEITYQIKEINSGDAALNYTKGLQIGIRYTIYEGYPVIRKTIRIKNTGHAWLKITDLVQEQIELKQTLPIIEDFTPSERGADSSIRGFSSTDKSYGVIIGSEIPSAIRKITKQGVVGYNPDNFEWVLGPGEEFLTEPVFYFGFAGAVTKTISSTSYPVDRIIEGKFKEFLVEHLPVRAVPEKMPVPLWCTWSNFVANINDTIIREQADLAARCGFSGFQIDAGWSESKNNSDWTCGSRVPHQTKFPEFAQTCKYIQDKGLTLGLWMSCYRNADSPDLQDLPDCISLPKVTRGEGIGMSFASEWKHYFAKDIINLHNQYGAMYFKQDLTNMKFGDIAEGHESRTRLESKLRAIRGYLDSQDEIAAGAPDVVTLLSHEIYWGTPGVPCDLAAITHCWTFHIPPNDYSGAYPRSERAIKRKKSVFHPYHHQLLKGCWNARNRNFLHRGLPLYCIEYYGAATVDFDGSLTSEVQDRQVCSWLMGVPSVYAGDLSSLSDTQISHYNQRLTIVKQMQAKYGIFRYYQYSGVPSPTDKGWHWWGKLQPNGSGVVVVLRGKRGTKGKVAKKINIPWVIPENSYRLRTLLVPSELGAFSGQELRNGQLILELPRWGQEIVEVELQS